MLLAPYAKCGDGRGWKWISFKVPSTPNRSLIPSDSKDNGAAVKSSMELGNPGLFQLFQTLQPREIGFGPD